MPRGAGLGLGYSLLAVNHIEGHIAANFDVSKLAELKTQNSKLKIQLNFFPLFVLSFRAGTRN